MPKRPLPALIGPVENALRALLVQTLEPTAIGGYEDWVMLNIADSAGDPAAAVRAAAGALKVRKHAVLAVEARMTKAGLMDAGTLTRRGREELETGRRAVSAVTAELVAGIGDKEQETAAAVLDRIRARAEALLAMRT